MGLTVKQTAAGFVTGWRQLVLMVNDFLLKMSGICTVLLSYFEQIIVLVSQFKIFLFETMVVLCKTCHITLFHLSPFTSIFCQFIVQLLLPYILSSKNSAFIFFFAVITTMLFKLVESGIWVNCQFASQSTNCLLQLRLAKQGCILLVLPGKFKLICMGMQLLESVLLISQLFSLLKILLINLQTFLFYHFQLLFQQADLLGALFHRRFAFILQFSLIYQLLLHMLGSLHQPVIPHSTFFVLFCEFFQYLLSFFPFMLQQEQIALQSLFLGGHFCNFVGDELSPNVAVAHYGEAFLLRQGLLRYFFSHFLLEGIQINEMILVGCLQSPVILLLGLSFTCGCCLVHVEVAAIS